MHSLHILSVCIFFRIAAGQNNYDPNRNNNNYSNNPNYNNYNNSSNYNNNPYNPSNQNYNPYGPNNSNYNSDNRNYNPNYSNRDPNNPNYNFNRDPNNPNYNNNRDPNNPNYNSNRDPNSPNYNSNRDPNSPNYNSNRDPNSPNYNSNRDPNNPNNNRDYNPNNPNYNRDYNNPNNQNFNPNNRDYNNRDFNNPNNPNYNRNNQNFNNNNNPNQNSDFISQSLDQSDCCEEYCYTGDTEPYLYFGAKTAYDSLTKRGGNQHNIPDCKPVQFWSLIRHGTRLPDVQTIRAMRGMNKIHSDIVGNYENRRSYPDRGRLCSQDYDLFRNWRFNESINEGIAESLSKQGVEDMKQLARRFKAKYSDLLQNYDEQSYYFQYSMIDRVHDSFQAYIEGLFDQDAFRVHANTVDGNRLTNPFQNCPKWQESQNTQFTQKSEVERFKEKPEYQKLIRDVFRKLGFRFTLNPAVIQDMYDLCRYEKAWNPQPRSPWCIAFNKEQLKILEYAEDLKHFYTSGYGNRMSEEIGCSPIKDMYERFERRVNGNADANKASFIFGESDTFLSALTALGVAKEFNQINSENYFQQTRREWRTSTLSPFAANLAAVLYECSRGEKYRVMFFLNENPIDFPDCSVGLCNWSTIQQKYQTLVNTCNLDYFCYGRSGGVTNYSTLLVVLITSLFVVRL